MPQLTATGELSGLKARIHGFRMSNVDGLKVHMNRDKASKRFLLVSFLEELSSRPTYFEKTGAV